MEQKIRQYCADNMRKEFSEVSVHSIDAKECLAVLDRRVVMVFNLQESIDSMDTDTHNEDNVEITAAYRASPEYSNAKEIVMILNILTEFEYDVIKKCIAIVLNDNTMEVVLTREKSIDVYNLKDSDDDDVEKAPIITILQQPTAVLNRFIHNYIYLWVFYADKVQLVNFKLASQPKEICPLFYIDTSKIGPYHPQVCELLPSSNGEGTLLALYFNFGREIRVYTVDTRHALWQAEKKRIPTNSKDHTSRRPASAASLSYIDAATITPLVIATDGQVDSIHVDPKSIRAYTRGTYHDDYRFPYSFSVIASIRGRTITQTMVSEEQYLIDFMVKKGVNCLVNANLVIEDPDEYIQLGISRGVDDKVKHIVTTDKGGRATCNQACAASTLWVRPLTEDILRGKKFPRNIFLLETLLATGHGKVIADYINHKSSTISNDYVLTDYARVYNWAVGEDAEFSYKAYLRNEISSFNKRTVLTLLLDKDVFEPSSKSKLQSRNVPISTTMLLQQMYNMCNGLGIVMEGLLLRQNDSFNGDADMKQLYMLGLEKNLMEIESLQRLVHLLSIIAQDRRITLAMVGATGEGAIYNVIAQTLLESFQAFNRNAGAALNVNMAYNQLTGDKAIKTEELNKLFFLSHSIITSVNSIESVDDMLILKWLQDCSDGLLLYFIAHMHYATVSRSNSGRALVQKLDAFYHQVSDSVGVSKSVASLMLALFKIDRNIDVAAAVQCLCEGINLDFYKILRKESVFRCIATTLLSNKCNHELYLLLNTCKSYYLDSISWDVFTQYYCDSLTTSTTWVSGLQIARRFCGTLPSDYVTDAKQIVIRRFFEYARSIKSLPHFLTHVAMDEVEIIAIYSNFDELISADCTNNNLKTPLIDVAFYWLLHLNRPDQAWELHSKFDNDFKKTTDFDISNFRKARITAYEEYNMHPFFRIN